MTVAQLSFNSPLGALTVTEVDGVIVALDWGWGMESQETPLLAEARRQLDAYFDRELKAFDLPLDPHGTVFQRKVWDALCTIPWGEVRSYGELAHMVGSAPRAIGGACGRNPIPIIIPCHRVLATGGGIGGYSGLDGVETKVRLLRLEGHRDRVPV